MQLDSTNRQTTSPPRAAMESPKGRGVTSPNSFDNVYACQGTMTGSTTFDTPGSGVYAGQCSELTARFAWAVYGLWVTGVNYGYEFVSVAHSKRRSIPVGSPRPGRVPVAGHIISLGPRDWRLGMMRGTRPGLGPAGASGGSRGSSLSPPTNASASSISGTTQQGKALMLTHGAWTNSPTSYSDQWLDCDSTGNSCNAIAGATSQTYMLDASDISHTIRVNESATNAGGTGGGATSSPTATVSDAGGGGGHSGGGGGSSGSGALCRVPRLRHMRIGPSQTSPAASTLPTSSHSQAAGHPTPPSSASSAKPRPQGLRTPLDIE